MDKIFPNLANDKQSVFERLNKLSSPAPRGISRRAFCTLSSLSCASIFLPGCTTNKESSLKQLSQEAEFALFYQVIFPAAELGLSAHTKETLIRIQNLEDKYARIIAKVFQLFKQQLRYRNLLGNKQYTKALGEACLIDLLNSSDAEQCSFALNIIYYELSKDSELVSAVWGRKFSLNDRKCIYWDNYDQAIS